MKIYVGNLSSDTTEDELRREFESFGKVDTVSVVRDRYSGQPRGFAFVEMSAKAEAQAAIVGLKGKMLSGRTLDVNEAHPRPSGGRGGGPQRGGKGKGGRGFGGGFGGRGRRF